MIRDLALTIGILVLSTGTPLCATASAEETSTGWPLRLTAERHDAVQLVGWEEDDTLTFRGLEGTPDGQILRRKLKDVVRFGRGMPARGGQGLLLVDGSFLAGRVARITETQCVISGRYFDTTVPRPLVRAMLLTAPPINGLQAEIIRDALSAVGDDDVVIGVDGDRTIGTLQPPSQGDAVVWERGGETLELVQGGRPVGVPVSRIRALIFSALLTPVFGAHAEATTVGLADGTRMQVRRFREAAPGAAEAVHLELVCGAQIAAPTRRWSASAVTYISPRRSGGSDGSTAIRRLSEQPPLRVRAQPMFRTARDLTGTERKLSTDGGITVDGHWYSDAIAMPSASQAVYRGLASGGQLRADVAIRDPDAPDAAIGSVRFRVLIVGDEGRLQEVWKSQMVRGGEGLVAIDVPLPPTPAVVLVVEPGERGGAGDRAVWIDAILIDR